VTAPILQARSLVKSYDTAEGGLQAVDHLDFAVSPGEFLCIVGPSGCGKTTLLQILAGLVPASAGDVLFDGRPLNEPHRDISMVFQKPNLMPWRNVLDNVLLPMQIFGTPRNEALDKARKILEKVGLAQFETAYPKALSGGMEQRVAVARAMVQSPRLLLLDEPFGSLDALTREKLNLELLRLWRDQNITAIMVTHNIREAALMSDRVLVLSPRPSMIAAEIPVRLPRPRFEEIEYTKEFTDLTFRIRRAIRD
jgi:NitT/TauT family transport system ATP-binding protein